MAWWSWLVRPVREGGRVYTERKMDQKMQEYGREHGLPAPGDPVYRESMTREILKNDGFSQDLYRISRRFEWGERLHKANLIQELLQGERPGAIGPKGGVMGQTQQVALNAFQGVEFQVDKNFYRVLHEYRREMDMGLAEVLLKRVSNVMMITSRDLSKNGKYRNIIMSAAVNRQKLYKRKAEVNPEKYMRLGAFLLQQATEKETKVGKRGKILKNKRGKKGGKHKTWAKKLLPKPTPKWVIGMGASSGKRGKGAWHESLERYTTRFIEMERDMKKRFNEANNWYRGGIAWAMNGVLRSSRRGRMGVKVDTTSRGYIDAKKVWDEAITRAQDKKSHRGKGIPMGKGTMMGSRDKPAIYLRFSGTLAPKVFPSLFRHAFKKDTEDMERYLQRRSMRRIR